MKFTSITYGLKVALSRGQFENVSVTVQVEPDEDPVNSFEELRDFVYERVGVIKVVETSTISNVEEER